MVQNAKRRSPLISPHRYLLVLLTALVTPPRMLSKLPSSDGTSLMKGISKQTDHERCTHHLPPFFNLVIARHAKICPAQCIFGWLESILNPSSKAIAVANLTQFDRRGSPHDEGSRRGGQRFRVSGQKPVLLTASLVVNHLRQIASLSGAIAKGALKPLPRLLVDLLVLRQPQGIVATNCQHVRQF